MFNENTKSAVDLLVIGAEWVYKKINNPKPITNAGTDPKYQDKKRYDILCNTYRQYIKPSMPPAWDIPPQWVLNGDSCPTFQTNFLESSNRLKKEREKLESNVYPLVNYISGMISSIEQLIIELEKRNSMFNIGPFSWKQYRSDSYEMMFFTDLALWLTTSFPVLSVYEQTTIDIVFNRIKFCNEVLDTVLMHRDDQHESINPKKTLADVISTLEELHANICKAQKAASFNMRIQAINSSILNMNRSVFDILYRIIESAPHYELQVKALLSQYEKKIAGDDTSLNVNLQKILNTLMGNWLVETLKKAGINSNSYENRLPIDMDTIHLHLNTNFKNLDNPSYTGLTKYVYLNKKLETYNKIEGYLLKIIEIHRNLLNLYSVRESVVLGAMVCKEYGDAWVYGEDAGRSSILILSEIVFHSCDKLAKSVEEFWKSFFDEDYNKNYGLTLDTSNPVHSNLIEARHIKERFFNCKKIVRQKLMEITNEIISYNQIEHQQKMLNAVHDLKHSMSKYVKLHNLNLPTELTKELDTSVLLSVSKFIKTIKYSSPGNGIHAEEVLLVEYKKSNLKYYQYVEKILSDEVPFANNELQELYNLPVIGVSKTEFHSDTQWNIYKNYILSNERVAKLPNWLQVFSFFHGISPQKIDNFLKTYHRIKAVMRLIYKLDDKMLMSPHKLPKKLPELEIILIDKLLYNFIMMDFEKNEYYDFELLPLRSDLEVKFQDETVQIVYPQKFIELCSDVLQQEINNLQLIIKEKDETIKKLEDKNKLQEDKNNLQVEEIKDLKKSNEQQKEKNEQQVEEIKDLKKSNAQLKESNAQLNELLKNQDTVNSFKKPNNQTNNYLPSLSFFNKNYQKFELVLTALPSRDISLEKIKTENPLLIISENDYYFVGFSGGAWRLTQLESSVLSKLDILHPSNNERITLNYQKHLKPLYQDIFDKNAHDSVEHEKVYSSVKQTNSI